MDTQISLTPPPINLDHLRALTDDTGLLQHARFQIPRRDEGYCVDDNARALLLTTLMEAEGLDGKGETTSLSQRYLAFVNHAFNTRNGRFRNFMAYDRTWLEEAGSEDSHGRAIWALGTVAGRSGLPTLRILAVHLLRAALPAVPGFAYPRSWAYTLLGLHEYLKVFDAKADPAIEACGLDLANRLLEGYRQNRRKSWHWFEDQVTYGNARLPQALLLTGTRTGNNEFIKTGLEALAWLCDVQTAPEGQFAPVGSNGFYLRTGTRAAFDQQPVETCGSISACLDAWRATGDPVWLTRAQWAFRWYLGDNQLQLPLWDPGGGCRDGLENAGRNENQGAESTLSFLLSQVELSASTFLRGPSGVSGRIPRPGSPA